MLFCADAEFEMPKNATAPTMHNVDNRITGSIEGYNVLT